MNEVGAGFLARLGSPVTSPKNILISPDLLSKARLYVLNNCPDVAPFVE